MYWNREQFFRYTDIKKHLKRIYCIVDELM